MGLARAIAHPPGVTFSLLALDPDTGAFGSAVASRSVAVGGTVAYSRVGVGAVNTQHYAHLTLGERVLDEMERGLTPREALQEILTVDPGADVRQLIAMDAEGRTASFTGVDCVAERHERQGRDCIAAGNHLASRDVVERMVRAFEASAGRDLGERLLRALEAGQEAGGDRRGRQAAAVKVVPVRLERPVAVNLDLRVDDHPDPLAELRRLHRVFLDEFGEERRPR